MAKNGNMVYWDVIQECGQCAEARKLAARLEQLTSCAGSLQLTAVPVADKPTANGTRVVVGSPRVACDLCSGTGYVLTEAGRDVVQLLQQQGVLPAGLEMPPIPPPAAPILAARAGEGFPPGDEPVFEE